MNPFRLLKINNDFQKKKPGDLVEITIDEPQVLDDLFKVLPENSYEIVKKVTFENGQTCKVILRKRS